MELIRQYLKTIRAEMGFLTFLNQHKIGGYLPLDWLAHFLVGMVITLICLRFQMRHAKVFSLVLILSLAKELFDWFALETTWAEHTMDIVVGLIYPGLVWGVRLLKDKYGQDHSNSGVVPKTSNSEK